MPNNPHDIAPDTNPCSLSLHSTPTTRAIPTVCHARFTERTCTRFRQPRESVCDTSSHLFSHPPVEMHSHRPNTSFSYLHANHPLVPYRAQTCIRSPTPATRKKELPSSESRIATVFLMSCTYRAVKTLQLHWNLQQSDGNACETS